MTCDCITKLDAALAKDNMKLDVSLHVNEELSRIDAAIGIRTVLIEPKRGKRAVPLLAAFCPFCGKPTKWKSPTRGQKAKAA